jgi:hypothetical protein
MYSVYVYIYIYITFSFEFFIVGYNVGSPPATAPRFATRSGASGPKGGGLPGDRYMGKGLVLWKHRFPSVGGCGFVIV